MKPTDKQHEFVERVGLWWETVGSRSAGRILGWLMICEPPHRSASQLAEELHLSAGSISTQTTALERVGFVERITFPGDRVSYYQLKPKVWIEVMRTEQQSIAQMVALAAAGEGVVPEVRPDRLTDMGRVAGFFQERWADLMDELEQHLEEEEPA